MDEARQLILKTRFWDEKKNQNCLVPFHVIIHIGCENIVEVLDGSIVEKCLDPKTFLVETGGDRLRLQRIYHVLRRL